MEGLRAGVHYPSSLGEFQAWFASDADCLDYLAWLRWPDGFHCPSCRRVREAWGLADGRFMCVSCGYRRSVTAGTIFHRTRTPMSVWFMACWSFATNKNGISALGLKRSLDIGSYQTAWTMLHRLRSVAVRPRRERLRGVVEVDETFIGGLEPGLPGGRAKGKKILVGVAVEVRASRGIGRCRMAPLPDASRHALVAFLRDHVEPGSKVVTDAWHGYTRLEELGYVHERTNQRAARAEGTDLEALLPAVHRVASLTKRWLLGTHQGRVSEDHLPRYLNEFVFRFNRRTARHRGLLFHRLLENAVRHEPLASRDIVAHPRPRSTAPTPPTARGHPPSLQQTRSYRPWRHAAPNNSD